MTIQSIKKEVQSWDKAQQADLMHFLVELLTNDQFQLSENWKNELAKREEALNLLKKWKDTDQTHWFTNW